MSIPGTPKGCERVAYAVGFKENATYSDVYGGGGAVVGLDCHLLRPTNQPSETLVVFMHPVGGVCISPWCGSWHAKGIMCCGQILAIVVQITH